MPLCIVWFELVDQVLGCSSACKAGKIMLLLIHPMALPLIFTVSTLLLGQRAFAQTPFYKGALQIQPVLDNSKCLTSLNGNTNGSPVVIADCNGSVDQQFTFSNGAVTAYNGVMCLDVTNGSDVNGNKLQLYTCYAGSTYQQWYYTGDYHLAWTNHGRCVDLPSGSTANGNQVQIWDCQGGETNPYTPNQTWNVGYWAGNLPATSQNGQTGTNNCGTGSSATSQCQTLWINSLDDFCLWGPPVQDTIGNIEREAVAYCTHGTHGARVMPAGTLTGVHFVKTPEYVQITGVGDFTKINIPAGDEGGELDNHGADGNGNPIGGLIYGNVFGNQQQFHEWTEFISYNEFCIRACIGPNATRNCQHIYDVMGCHWNIPANYDAGVFESCSGDVGEPMGVYTTGGTTSTWYQGVSPTPSAHPAPASSSCVTTATVGTGS